MLNKQVTDYIYNSHEMLTDPHAVFKRIRQQGNVVWSPLMRRWLVLSKSAATDVLKNKAFDVYSLFNALKRIANKSGEDFGHLIRICEWIPFLHDGARHSQLRGLFASILGEMRAEYLIAIESVSRQLLKELKLTGGGDFSTGYAERLHVEALGALLNIPKKDLLWIAKISFSQGSVDFAASVGEMRDANARAKSLLDYICITLTKLNSSPFLVSLRAKLSAAGIEATDSKCVECISALIFLGRDTLAGTLSVGLAHMLDSKNGILTPTDWNNLVGLEDEFIRLSSTVQIVNRVATSDVKLDGQQIAKGDVLMIFLPAANRDSDSFTCPHAISSENGNHIAFGSGRHLCVGLAISREVVAIAIRHLSELVSIKSCPGRRFSQGKNTRAYSTFPIKIGV